MKSFISKVSVAAMVLAMSIFFGTAAFAEEGVGNTSAEEIRAAATSISISPVNKILEISANSVYEDSFKVTNNGTAPMEFEVYAAPYSYTYSETDEAYKLGFNNANNYTQITRWITFRDTAGRFVETTTFTAEPGASVEVVYRISTPSSIPAGGQYAVLFAHTLSGTTNASGIKTEASPGLVVYGRSDGETLIDGSISGLQINETMLVDGENKSIINGTSKVKNTGNVDFMASGKLKVTGIFGNVYYETPSTSGRISIIPESELTVSDSWEDTAYFGLFNVSWTVSIADTDKVETITKLVLLLPAPVIVVMILLLTIIIVWIIISIRKRKERRSRFMV